MIDKKNIEQRIVDLENDAKKIQGQIKDIEQLKVNAVAQLNALLGAKQQCETFLKEAEPGGEE
jgi:hypothetical protein